MVFLNIAKITIATIVGGIDVYFLFSSFPWDYVHEPADYTSIQYEIS